MSNAISELKARYCRSVLRTAATGADHEARHLINALATERPTADTRPDVAGAERAALAAITALATHLQNRSIAFAAAEWSAAEHAVLHWIAMFAPPAPPKLVHTLQFPERHDTP
jgi:hypothetical protein